MSSADKPVRIIKRKERELPPVVGTRVPLAKTERQIERGMVQTVASWIDERREAVRRSSRSYSATSLLPLESNLETEGG